MRQAIPGRPEQEGRQISGQEFMQKLGYGTSKRLLLGHLEKGPTTPLTADVLPRKIPEKVFKAVAKTSLQERESYWNNEQNKLSWAVWMSSKNKRYKPDQAESHIQAWAYAVDSWARTQKDNEDAKSILSRMGISVDKSVSEQERIAAIRRARRDFMLNSQGLEQLVNVVVDPELAIQQSDSDIYKKIASIHTFLNSLGEQGREIFYALARTKIDAHRHAEEVAKANGIADNSVEAAILSKLKGNLPATRPIESPPPLPQQPTERANIETNNDPFKSIYAVFDEVEGRVDWNDVIQSKDELRDVPLDMYSKLIDIERMENLSNPNQDTENNLWPSRTYEGRNTRLQDASRKTQSPLIALIASTTTESELAVAMLDKSIQFLINLYRRSPHLLLGLLRNSEQLRGPLQRFNITENTIEEVLQFIQEHVLRKRELNTTTLALINLLSAPINYMSLLSAMVKDPEEMQSDNSSEFIPPAPAWMGSSGLDTPSSERMLFAGDSATLIPGGGFSAADLVDEDALPSYLREPDAPTIVRVRDQRRITRPLVVL